MLVRPALAADAEAMSAVLIASITELCFDDHQGDPVRIAQWTGNKSANGVRAMLTRPDLKMVVAEIDHRIAGVAGFNGNIIALNYVAPAFRYRGVSRALMQHMEAAMAAAGVITAVLDSSATAYRF